jgi:uroporphyrinogen III methyltransferase/synthase
LVGAGPGDPKLLTVRGKECLEQADVVLYDFLANPVLLDHAPPQAERMYVGRRGRGRYADQADINRLLIAQAKDGKVVVRLKGGDPFVFGRGGEEAEALATSGIPFEVIPGISSAIAAPAYAGIPVTHRTLASSVTIVTGHEDPTKEASALEWGHLASTKGTLVFLMGMKNLPAIVDSLKGQGREGSTPVALIRWGTKTTQRTVVGTLDTIVALGQEAGLEPPTVIVVGDVVRLRTQLNWFESRPLFGKRVLVTRAQEQAKELSDLLAGYGADPVECPTIRVVAPDSWEDMDTAISRLSEYRWILFTSVNGIAPFMTRLRAVGKDVRSLASAQVACIGPRTAQELERYGVVADLVPDSFQAEGLLESLGNLGVRGQRILVARAAVAREILPTSLRAMGATVDVVAVYRTVRPEVDAEWLRTLLRDRAIHVITFTSSSTVKNFRALFESREDMIEMVGGARVACIGPITAETAKEEGLRVSVTPKENTIPSLVDALVQAIGVGATVS